MYESTMEHGNDCCRHCWDGDNSLGKLSKLCVNFFRRFDWNNFLTAYIVFYPHHNTKPRFHYRYLIHYPPTHAWVWTTSWFTVGHCSLRGKHIHFKELQSNRTKHRKNICKTLCLQTWLSPIMLQKKCKFAVSYCNCTQHTCGSIRSMVGLYTDDTNCTVTCHNWLLEDVHTAK